jgi:hypothetical protein
MFSLLIQLSYLCIYSIDAYRVLVGRPIGKSPHERPRRSWADNIKMYLYEVEWGGMDWIALAHDMNRWRAFVNEEMNIRVP